MRQCLECLILKPRREFARDDSRRDGLSAQCSSCARTRQEDALLGRRIRAALYPRDFG